MATGSFHLQPVATLFDTVPQWSDGRERSANFAGSSLNRAITAYFAEHREEELLALRWDNEHMRAELERQRAFDKAHPGVVAVMQKAMRASA